MSYRWEVRAETYRLLLDGYSISRTAEAVGVTRQCVAIWAKLAGMETFSTRAGSGLVLPPSESSAAMGSGGYRRLTLADRSFIEQALHAEAAWSMQKIAGHLGVSASTISREVSKNRIPHASGHPAAEKAPHYSAAVAHYRAMWLRHRAGPRKLDDPVLRGRVVALLDQGWSPDAIAGRLKLEFPDQPEKHVSHETIYQALYVQGKGSLRDELKVVKALRTGRTSRIPQSRLPRQSNRPWLQNALLTDRPAAAKDRAVPGHWEGDLVVGPNNSGIVTLVERRSRFALLGRLPAARDSKTVIDRMLEMVHSLPKALFTTVTWDQGAEMAQHVDFTVATGCKLFFCDPHSPWQRGSNENLNRLVRDFFPKGTDFNDVTSEDLAEAQLLLNTRPRKTLGYWTPSERLRETIGVALTA